MEKNVFIKLPIRVRYNINENKIVDGKNNCEECKEQSNNLGVPMSKLCPECDESNNSSENKKNFRMTKTYDYVRPEDIENFFALDKKTVTVVFYNNKVVTYKITEAEFLKKFEGLIKIV